MAVGGAAVTPGRDDSVADGDVRLLERVAAGDLDAFTRLVERHEQRLLRVAERLLHDREEARDVVQEVFVKAFRKAASFEPRAKVSTWLYRIAVNHCLNLLRRRKVVRMISFGSFGQEDDESEWEAPAEGPDAHRRLEGRERWRQTRRAIAELPPGQRAVLVLARFEGLRYREIAETLGITMGAVESRLFRAMRALEAAREAQESEPPAVARRGDDHEREG